MMLLECIITQQVLYSEMSWQVARSYCAFRGSFYSERLVLKLPTGRTSVLIFRHCASCILGQAFYYSPESAFYTFNQQIYFII